MFIKSVPILRPAEVLPQRVSLSNADALEGCARLISDALEAAFHESRYARDAKPNLRMAYVTLATPDYDLGLRVLLRSLRRTSQIPVFVLVPSRWALQTEVADVFAIEVPHIVRDDAHRDRHEFGATFTKLWAFGLSGFERVIFLDSDFLVLQSLDELFEGSEFLVCRDSVERTVLDRFNTGLLAISPRRSYFDRIRREGATAPSYDGGDQGLLNTLFGDEVKYLSSEFNTIKHYWYFAHSEVDRDKTKGVHFIVKKPWEIWYREITDAMSVDLEDIWTAHLTHSELLRLVSQWRRDQFVTERGRFDATRGGGRRERRLRRQENVRIFVAVGAAVVIFIAGMLVGRLF
jgi:hypothetical protein